MKTKIGIATFIYMLLLFMAFSKRELLEVSNGLIVSSTLFFALYAIALFTNHQNLSNKNR